MPAIFGTTSNDTVSPAGISSGVLGGVPDSGNDTIFGLEGNDLLNGGSGSNSILGGAGDDTIVSSGSNETLYGGTGIDTILYLGTTGIILDLGTGVTSDGYQGFLSYSSTSNVLYGFERGYAGTGDDTIRGSHDDNVLGGDRGNDSMDGRTGWDIVDYSWSALSSITKGVIVNLSSSSYIAGSTTLPGGTARDPWDGIDILANIDGAYGTDFADTMLGNNLENLFVGGLENDSLTGSGGNDTLDAGAGDDILRGGDGDDSILGGAGSDTVFGAPGNDTVDGGSLLDRNRIDYAGNPGAFNGAVRVTYLSDVAATVVKTGASGGTDTLLNINELLGTNNADTFDLAAVSPTAPTTYLIRGGAGADTIIGNGNDRVVADYNAAASAVSVDLQNGIVAGGDSDILQNVRSVIATSAWNDTLSGSSGNDTFIVSGLGNKTISGGAGIDTYRYRGSASVFIDLDTDATAGSDDGVVDHSGSHDILSSIENAYGGTGDDTIRGSTGDNILAGDKGADNINGRQGFDIVDYSVYSTAPITTGVIVNLSSAAETLSGANIAANSARDPWGSIDILQSIEGEIGTDFADVITGSDGANLVKGGGGADTVSTGGGNDTVFGGDGNDLIRGGDGDDLLDGGAGFDTAQVAANSDSASWARNPLNGNWTVSSAEGNDTLTGFEAIRFADRLVMLPRAADDLNGSSSSDILWRHADGQMAAWFMDGASGSGAGYGAIDPRWTIAGIGDFGGDQKDDLLWRHADGYVALWQMDGAKVLGSTTLAQVDASWTIAGVGDLNGDRYADILWCNSSGDVSVWLMQGTASIGGGTFAGGITADWKVAALADFDGDSRADILWLNTNGDVALWRMDGTNILAGQTIARVASTMAVAGTGDFNGDGKADIVWQDATTGAVSVTTMNGLAILDTVQIANSGSSWHVAAVGDYNGDHKADLLWRGADGTTVLWLMDGTTLGTSVPLGNPGTDWQVV